MKEVKMPIIGYMNSPYQEKFGIPRQPNLVQVESYIEMLAPYNDLLAFEGIEEFSHLWLIWQFHDNKTSQDSDQFRAQVRPPRLGGNKKIGVFATRSMYRPSAIGLSVVKLKQLEKVAKGVRLYVTGSDLLDGTPILDIKPYIHYSDSLENAQSGYAQDEPKPKEVVWQEQAELQKRQWLESNQMTQQRITELEQILSLDPRPAYHHDQERVYGIKFAQMNVRFRVESDQIIIQSILLTT